MQAIIIAGGKGTRISSITTKIPKSLLPLNNKPLIDYSINHLSNNGYDNIIICCGHLGNKLKEYIEGNNYSVPIKLSMESKPLGTAGALHLIKNMLADEFLVLFGDIFTTINLRKMLQFHRQKKADATLALHASDHPHDSTVVKIDKNNKLLNFIEKPGDNWKEYGNLTATSLYILKKSIINFIPKDKTVDFAKDVFPKMLKKGKKLFGYVTREYVKDIGTPKRYKEVEEYIRRKNNFLITGTSSGLGKFLHNNLGGLSLNRQTSEGDIGQIKREGAAFIIHCAFNSDRDPKNIDQYFKDNVLLTEELTKIQHKKFILISSVDIYPKNFMNHSEDEVIDINKIDTLYGKTKLMSEELVIKNCSNFLILRCTALVGKDSRRNNLIKIFQDDKPTLTLSGKSVFNYILHSDLLDLIKLAIKRDLKGIYNVASSKNTSLSEAARLFKKRVKFGDYIYNVGKIENAKVAIILPAFKKTSREVISIFCNRVLI